MPRQSQAEAVAYIQGFVNPLNLMTQVTQRELAEILQDAAKQAFLEVSKSLLASGNASASSQVRARQLTAAGQGLSTLASSVWGRIGAQTRAGIFNAADLAVTQQIDRDYLIGMPFKAIQSYSDGLYFSAFQSAESIISRKVNNIDLSQRIRRNAKATVIQEGKIINRGLAQQLSAREIAKQVRDHFRPDVPGGASYAAMRLARTEINNAHHTTTVRLSERQPWVKSYKWHLSRSHPKPDICDQYAKGGPYKKGKVPSKPHPQCLCYLEIEQEDKEDFLDNLVAGTYDSYLKDLGAKC